MAGVRITNPDTGTSFLIRDNEVNAPQYKGYVTDSGSVLTGGAGNASGGGGTGSSSGGNNEFDDYLGKLNDFYSKQAQAEAEAKRQALLGAYQGNQQALNQQKSTVTDNYESLVNRLNATRDSQLPLYQEQRDAASADAAAQLRRTQALNALTGKYFSGANRSQMMNVDLSRAKAIQGITQGENQFTTDMTNKLSDADAQRVSALNDIAEKLALNKRQYESGTLSLENQLASTEAANAAKAYVEAMDWLTARQKQESEADYQNELLELKKKIAADEDAYRNAKLAQDREQFRAGLNSRGSSSSYRPTQGELIATNTANAMNEIQDLIKSGWTREQINEYMRDGRPSYTANLVDMNTLNDWFESTKTYEEMYAEEEALAAAKNKKAWDALPWYERLKRGTIFGPG